MTTRYEMVQVCKRMKYEGWRSLSTLKLSRFLGKKRREAAIKIQRWVRTKLHYVNDEDFFTLQKIDRKNAFVLRDNEALFLFRPHALLTYFQTSQHHENPFTRNAVSATDVERLERKCWKQKLCVL